MESDGVKVLTTKVAPLSLSSHTINDTGDKELQSTFYLGIVRFILTVIITTFLWSCGTYTAYVTVQGINPVLLAWLCLVALFIVPAFCYIIMWICGEQSGSWKTLGVYNITAILVIKRIFPICSLSLLALSLYFLALPRLCISEVAVLYSCNKAFSYLLSWTILRDQFMGARIVAIIFCMTGVVMMSYTESPDEEASSGQMLALSAAAVSAMNEVLTRLLIGKLNYQETGIFLGLCGICSFVLLWWVPLIILLHQKIEESELLFEPPIEYFCVTISVFSLYQILEKIGCLFLPGSGVSLGVFLSAAVIKGMNQQLWISRASPERYMMGFLAIGVGMFLLIIPENWRSYFCLAPKEQGYQDEASDETKSKGSLSAI